MNMHSNAAMDFSAESLHPNHELARKLARSDLPVFPCRDRDMVANGSAYKAKSPLTPNGFKDATTDLARIDEWWTAHPGAIVGLPTGSASGISVIDGDIDRETGEAVGEEQVAHLGLTDGRAVKVRTQSGGVQFLFRHIEGARNSTKKVASHVDTRGEGGYIIAPGSVMGNGAAYRYEGRSLSSALAANDLSDYPLEAVRLALEAKSDEANQGDRIDEGAARAGFPFDDGKTMATDAETIEVVRQLLGNAPNSLCREDWVKLAMSLRVAFGESLRSDFVSFSLGYTGGTPCTPREAERVWASAGNPNEVTSIAPALAMLKRALGDDQYRAPWRDVLGRREEGQSDGSSKDTSGDTWPDPDLNIGQPARPSAPVMSTSEFDLVFGPWADWIRTAAEVKNAPVDYVALSLLSVASAAIGNARWAVAQEGWKEPAVLWAMLVGDPSSGKSPALDAVIDPVKAIERGLSEDYRRAREEWEGANEIAALALAQWKAEAKSALAEGTEPPAKPALADAGRAPIRDRISITDITTEKVADLLSSTWRGLLLARDELSGWLSGMDRYNGGGDRPFWLEAYGGRSYTIDRKNSPEPIIVDHLSVAIVGGTQPDRLAELLVKTSDDGLLSRFMTVFPDPVPLAQPTARLNESRLEQAIARLRTLTPALDEDGGRRPFYIHLTDQATATLFEFRKRCREWETEASGLFKSHLGKMPGLTVRIANVLAHLDWAAIGSEPFPTSIDASHVGRACQFVGEHLRRHAYRAYGTSAPSPETEGARTIAEIIRDEHLRSLKVRDIQHRGRRHLTTAKEVTAALRVLVDADWLREIKSNSGGRPSVSYIVNPKLEATQ